MSSSSVHEVKHLVFYFQVHQPRRLRKFQFFDIGSDSNYFDDRLNEEIVNRIAKDCYLPANAMLLKLITSNPSIKVSFSISGVALDQFEKYSPEVIASFKALADTGAAEFLAETSSHSLASLMSGDEFRSEVIEHTERIQQLFGVRPSIFRNTELIYNNAIGQQVSDMGFHGMLCEGSEHVLGYRSPYQLYHHPDAIDFKLVLRSNKLSDDIAFRFNQGKQKLTPARYISWLQQIPESDRIVVLGMDYETFGEHHKKETGILTFLKDVLTKISKDTDFMLSTPSEVLQTVPSYDQFSTEKFISWADRDKDTSAWLGNDMQRDAFRTIAAFETDLKKLGNLLSGTWRDLLTSDHFYYMSTKDQDDGNVHSYFSHYPSPYEAFINYMNVLSDFELRVKAGLAEQSKEIIPSEK